MLRFLRNDPRNKNFKGRLQVIDKFAYTISTRQVRVPDSEIVNLSNWKYIYLTERECFNLIGFDDEDFDKLGAIYPQKKEKLSSILFKRVGNSMVVSCDWIYMYLDL
mgnify:CR=1 FL=1